MKKIIALVIAIAVLSGGCTGSFMLTKKVYNFHRSQDGKWMDELFFLGTVILPVYGLATLGDAIIFNSIEFWTDENPIEAKASSDKVVVADGSKKAELAYIRDKGSIRIDAKDQSLMLERRHYGVVARDENGKVLYTSVKAEDGSISIYDADHNLIKNVSAEQVTLAKNKLTR